MCEIKTLIKTNESSHLRSDVDLHCVESLKKIFSRLIVDTTTFKSKENLTNIACVKMFIFKFRLKKH